MEELDILDRLVLDWCQKNGWDTPQKINGIWYAIAPNCYVPEPVRISAELNEHISRLSWAGGGGLESTIRTAFAQLIGRINAVDFRGLAPLMKEINRAACSIPLKPPCEVETPVEVLSIKERDKRNQTMMRGFLKSRSRTRNSVTYRY